ncbi:MAG: hypothetical protein KKA60_14790 [Proteobacteria bacterium]|nr:hypothetical protein [Pseudomonadota bacterium]
MKIKRKNRLARLNHLLGRVGAAVTYAEAGSHEDALQELSAPPPENPQIIVLGKGDSFSPALRDYAIGLARRLGFDIIAVNSRYIPQEAGGGESPFIENLKAEFSEKAGAAAARFEEEAREAEVEFLHEVRFGEGTRVIRDLHKEFKKMQYFVAEPEEEGDGLEEPVIPVFSLAMG